MVGFGNGGGCVTVCLWHCWDRLNHGGAEPEEAQPIIRIITSPPEDIPTIDRSSVTNASVVENTVQTPGTFNLQGPTLEAVVITPTSQPITIGTTIKVEGVGESGLNIRDVAGITTGSTILFLGDEGEQFTVLEGPQQSDGLTWWRIQNPKDLSRTGWAASQYLYVVPNT